MAEARRRPRGNHDTTPTAKPPSRYTASPPPLRPTGALPGGNVMFFAATPPPVGTVAPKRTLRNNNARILKQSPVNRRQEEEKSHLTGGFGAPPNYQFNDTSGDAPDSSYVEEKLAFDALLRVQRARADDVGTLITELGASIANGTASREDSATDRERAKSSRAAKYREEWRVGREDEVLRRVCEYEAREAVMCMDDRQKKLSNIRVHVRQSIHFFLSADRGGPTRTSSTLTPRSTTTPQRKLSNDLFYAQQMDRLLFELDQQHPFAVVRQAITDARAKFQQLLLCFNGDSDKSVLRQLHQESTDTPTQQISVPPNAVVPDVLHLYENVVDARALAQAAVVSSATDRRAKKTPQLEGGLAISLPTAGFLGNLDKQRDEAYRVASESFAQRHWRSVCANRIRTSYVRYRTRQQWRIREAQLRGRVERRAAIVLQTTLRTIITKVQTLIRLKQTIKHKHQGRRIATWCFWKWVYPLRCGLTTFDSHVPSMESVVSVIRIQSAWKRWKACYEATYRRAIHDIRLTRQKRLQWAEMRQRAREMAQINYKLAEWSCHMEMEKNRVTKETKREQKQFTTEWSRYESKLEKDVMKSRLPPEWIPQLDPLSGETFYLNVQTTKTTCDHPNKTLFKQLLKKQRIRAEHLYHERQQRLEQYLERLEEERDLVTKRFFEELHSQLRPRKPV